MDELLPQKLELLAIYYPSYLKSALTEFLSECGGSIEKVKALIDGPKALKRVATQSYLPNLKKRQIAQEAQAMLNGKGKVITLNTPADVERVFGRYATLHRNFFPPDLAEALLRDLEAHDEDYRSHHFYLFGNKCELNHKVGAFSKPNATYSRLVYNGLGQRKPIGYTANFNEAAEMIQNFINSEAAPKLQRLPFQSLEPWNADFCVVNLYNKMSSNLEYHLDRLSHIGPHNFVSSISLGLTRMFRLRSNHRQNAPILQVPLPHNSLFIMNPGCQEEYKHSINPMAKPVDLHPRVGAKRYGLTFRHYPEKFILNSPRCKCGMGMTLRRAYKAVETRGRYFWSCENKYQNKDCGVFHWADFSNFVGHYVAQKPENISTWWAWDDLEKIDYESKRENGIGKSPVQCE